MSESHGLELGRGRKLRLASDSFQVSSPLEDAEALNQNQDLARATVADLADSSTTQGLVLPALIGTDARDVAWNVQLTIELRGRIGGLFGGDHYSSAIQSSIDPDPTMQIHLQAPVLVCNRTTMRPTTFHALNHIDTQLATQGPDLNCL